MAIHAQCEACGAAVEVPADDLFGFDPACPRCAGAMVLLEDEAPAADEDRPTQADDEGARRLDAAPDDLAPIPFHDLPTKADTDESLPEDPYVAAAVALDSTVTGPRPRPAPSTLSRRLEGSGVSRRLEGSGRARLEGSGRARLLAGTPPGAPPLPAWDDSDALSALARAEPAPAAPPPPLEEPDSAELDGLAPVMSVPATAGRGSRTFERGDLAPPAAPAEGAGGAAAPPGPVEASAPGLAGSVPALRPGASARQRRRNGSSTKIPRPRGTGAHARPPTGGSLFGEDLDWLALIDDSLPELEVPEDTGAPRVLVRLPEAAAPTGDADAAQIDRFRSAVQALERGGPTAIAELLGTPPAPSTTDSRPAKRFNVDAREAADGKDVAAHAAAPPPAGEEDDSATTRALAAVPLGEEDTRNWAEQERRAAAEGARPASGRAPLQGNGRAADADEAPRKHPSGRTAGAASAERRKIEEFRHADLDPALVCVRDAGSVEADDFRQLYQRIFHTPRAGREAPRVVLVTSPDPGAGKTAVAANLAIVGARTPGRSAVLVDADPRGRGVLRAFGVPQRMEGLLEALQTHQDPGRAVVQFNLGNLDVVPLGIAGSDAAELVSSERMAAFLARLRDAYPAAVVLVDGSSVLHAADPLVLARNVDGVVLVVRAGRTAREDARRAVDLLGPERVLGLVLNGAAAA